MPTTAGTAGMAFVLAATGYAPGHVTEAARETIRWSCYPMPDRFARARGGVILFWPARARA